MKYHHAVPKKKYWPKVSLEWFSYGSLFCCFWWTLQRNWEKGQDWKKERKDRKSRKCTTYCTVGKGDLFPYSIENQTFWTCKIVCFLSYCDLPWARAEKKIFSRSCLQTRKREFGFTKDLSALFPSFKLNPHTHVVTSLALLSLLYPLATKSSLKSSKAVSRRKLRSSSSTTTLWDNPFLHMVLKLEKKLKESSKGEWDTH